MDHPQEQRRQQAVVRYLAGEKIEAICRDMHCSKRWLYKWKARSQAENPGWATGLSPQPRPRPRQTPEPMEMEQRVVTLRRTLGQSGQRGSATAIQQGLQQQGREPLPSLRTIYRILQRHAQEAISHDPSLASVPDLVVILNGPRGQGVDQYRYHNLNPRRALS
jgi:putative transposase